MFAPINQNAAMRSPRVWTVAVLISASCNADVPFDDAIRREDIPAVVDAIETQPWLGPPEALDAWFRRHPPGTHFHVSGRRFGSGEIQGRLGARIEASPGRWSDDHWPLGAIRYTKSGIVDIGRMAAPRSITGKVHFDPAWRIITGQVALGVRNRLVTFALGSSASTPLLVVATCNGRRLRLDRSPAGGWWAAIVPTESCEVELHYQLSVRNAAFDHWDKDVLALRRQSWLPAPIDRNWETTVEVTLAGLGDWTARTGTSLTREKSGQVALGRSDELRFLVARPRWTTKRAVVDGIDLEVAVATDEPSWLNRIWDRATEAITATKPLGELPQQLQVTEVPKGRAPFAAIDHIALPRERLSSHPLALAHEVVHVAYGPHNHVPFGLPTIEEPLAEYLALRAARSPDEAYGRRRMWQHLMREREGNDGRPLHDAFRLQVAQYYRGALILDSLSRRIGEDALVALVSPLDQRGVVNWSEFAIAVAKSHPEAAEWLNLLIAAKDLPELGVEIDGADLRLVDTGETGIPLTIEVRYGPGERGISTVVIGERLEPPRGTTYVIIDPEAHAPIRRAGSWTGRFDLPWNGIDRD